MNDPCDSTGIQDGSAPGIPRPVRLALDVLTESGDWSAIVGAEDLARTAAAAVASAPEIDVGHTEIAIALSSDAVVRALNATHRMKDKATNVLSFPAPPGMPVAPGSPRFLGDIVLAVETVMREAGEQSLPPTHHLQHLVVHGLLHLLGFDHQTDAEAERMERLETVILARLGIPDPYREIAP